MEEDRLAEIEFSCDLLLLLFCQGGSQGCWHADDGQGVANIWRSGEDIESREGELHLDRWSCKIAVRCWEEVMSSSI